MDGVLADFTKSARKISYRLFQKPSADAIQTGWGFDSLGLTQSEESLMWNKIKETPNFWFGLEPMPCTRLLPDLAKAHDLFFVTSRIATAGMTAKEQTKRWLQEYFGLDADVTISHQKGEAALRMNFDWFLDDKPSNLYDVFKADPFCSVVLCDATYNRDDTHLPRVDSFDDFAQLVLGGYAHAAEGG